MLVYNCKLKITLHDVSKGLNSYIFGINTINMMNHENIIQDFVNHWFEEFNTRCRNDSRIFSLIEEQRRIELERKVLQLACTTLRVTIESSDILNEQLEHIFDLIVDEFAELVSHIDLDPGIANIDFRRIRGRELAHEAESGQPTHVAQFRLICDGHTDQYKLITKNQISYWLLIIIHA